MEFGIAPAKCVEKLLKAAGLTMKDIDYHEINEAFAAVALANMKLGDLDPDHVNVHGGAVALGHPLGCTGARQIATLLNELHRRKQRFGVVSMCIGTGMGAAAVLEVEPESRL